MPISPGAEHRFEAVGMGRPGPDQGLLAGAEGLRQLPAYYSHWIGLWLIKRCSDEMQKQFQVINCACKRSFSVREGNLNCQSAKKILRCKKNITFTRFFEINWFIFVHTGSFPAKAIYGLVQKCWTVAPPWRNRGTTRLWRGKTRLWRGRTVVCHPPKVVPNPEIFEKMRLIWVHLGFIWDSFLDGCCQSNQCRWRFDTQVKTQNTSK